ncbi:hypothetical protein ACH4T9_20005 [Micromonospora sp. NPDC020750]|uniref:hypothetical protein n=1 Tax=unclassified Micromonospora TaxID=2617518 RepID=UPI0037B1C31F
MPNSEQHRLGTSPLVVEIGLKEIYDLLVALNTNVQILAGDIKDLSSKADDHEQRLRSLERARWPLPTLAALVSVGALILALLQYQR